MKPSHLVPLLLGSLALASAAHAPGSFAYTKRAETALLSEPAPMSAPTTKLKLGSKLKIEEVRGAWLRASAEDAAVGWIFKGNVSVAEPDKESALAQIPLDASATSATAAARPLAPAAADYGARKNLAKAQEDLAWLVAEGALVNAADITAYLEEKKLGEFQGTPDTAKEEAK
jgi:hypothetical protein